VTNDVEVVFPGTIADFRTARQRAGSRSFEWEFEGRTFHLPQSANIVLLIELPRDARDEGKE